MGYESRVYVVQKSKYLPNCANVIECVNVIACVNMSCMGEEFRDLFKNDVDFDMSGIDKENDEPIKTDCYGKTLKYTSDIMSVIDVLHKIYRETKYRRALLLMSVLDSIVINGVDLWKDGEILLVHYGY